MAGYALNTQINLVKSITCKKSSDKNKKILQIYAHLFICQSQNSKFKREEIPRKIMESNFSSIMHIYTLCPKYQQKIMK